MLGLRCAPPLLTMFLLTVRFVSGQEVLPTSCPNVEWKSNAQPVLFQLVDGVGFGISSNAFTFEFGDPITLAVWVDNETDKTYNFWTCETLFDWNVSVFDAPGHRLRSRDDKIERSGKPFVRMCAGNVLIQVSPQSCLVVPGLIPLSVKYDLAPGVYTVTELRSKPARFDDFNSPSLALSVVATKPAAR